MTRFKTTKRKKNKKGSIVDIILALLVMFALAVVIIIGNKALNEINTKLQGVGAIPEASKVSLQSMNDLFPTIFDYTFLVMTILLWIAVLVGAFVIDTHPALFVISAVVLGILIMVAAILANTYEDITSNRQFVDQLANYTIIPFVMGNLVNFLVLLGFTVLIALYAKFQLAGQ